MRGPDPVRDLPSRRRRSGLVQHRRWSPATSASSRRSRDRTRRSPCTRTDGAAGARATDVVVAAVVVAASVGAGDAVVGAAVVRCGVGAAVVGACGRRRPSSGGRLGGPVRLPVVQAGGVGARWSGWRRTAVSWTAASTTSLPRQHRRKEVNGRPRHARRCESMTDVSVDPNRCHQTPPYRSMSWGARRSARL